MDDFSSVKVGDRLWLHSNYYVGWVMVDAISTNAKSSYPIKVICTDIRYESISKHGHISEFGPQCLFWSEPTIIPPPKPKKIVTKTLEGHVNVYPNHIGCYFHPTRKSAKDEATHEVWCGEALATVKVTGTYEVEE